MTWVAVAIGGGAILGAVVSNNASNRAVNAQSQAAREANDLQWRMYQQGRDDQAPWRQTGGWALGELQGMLGQGGSLSQPFNFQADPGYAFRLQQGQQALQRSAAARGNSLGGGSLKALTRYNSGMASDEYGKAFDRWNVNNTNTFNRFASLAGLGHTAANQTGAYGMNAANQMGSNMLGIGNAQAAGAVASGNAWSGAMNGLGNAWQYYSMNRPNQYMFSPMNNYNGGGMWGGSIAEGGEF